MIEGNRVKAEANVQHLIELYRTTGGEQPCAIYIGLNLIRLGHVDEGFTWLERASNTGENYARILQPIAQDLPELQDNPRYQALLKKMNLDDESISELKERGPL